MVGIVMSKGASCREVDAVLAGLDPAKFSTEEVRVGDHVAYWGEACADMPSGERDEEGTEILYHVVPYGSLMARLTQQEAEARARHGTSEGRGAPKLEVVGDDAE